MPVVGAGQERERLTTVGHLNHGAARLLHAFLQDARELFHHQDGSTPVERLAEKAVAISMRPTQRHEERLRYHLTGIRRQTPHGTTRGASQNACLAATEEVHELTSRFHTRCLSG
jgi:hypothetical protein